MGFEHQLAHSRVFVHTFQNTNQGREVGRMSSYGKWTAFIQHFPNQWPLNAFYNIASHSPIHAQSHPPTAESPAQGDSQLVSSSQGEVLSQRHLDTQLGGAGGHTNNNLPVTSQPALAPELLLPYCLTRPPTRSLTRPPTVSPAH